MSWVLLPDSGLDFNIGSSDGVTYADSRFTSSGGMWSNTWALSRADWEPATYRVTAVSYVGDGPDGYPGQVAGVINEGGPDAWSPSPMTFEDVTSVYYQSGGEERSSFVFLVEVWIEAPDDEISYNCSCDDDYPRSTLASMRNRLARRLGFSVQVAMGALPPGMGDLLDDFIRQSQEVLYRRYSVFRMERWYTWDLVAGTRFYDLDANADACTKKLDPRKVTWCGISQGDDSWRTLVCGINPTMYTSQGPSIPSHYEIRQCIEVWPSPSDDTWKLRAKGYFGLQPLVADTDETTIDPEAIFLLALANAKAHYGQPDANNYASMATAYVRDLVRGQHHTRRYVPGECEPPPMVRPVPVGGWQ